MGWTDRRCALLDQLKLRNNSLFAHGFSRRPIGSAGWKSLQSSIGAFLDEAIAMARPIWASDHASLSQLPASLEKLGAGPMLGVLR